MGNTAHKLDYTSIDDRDILFLIKRSREGMKYSAFQNFQKNIPLKPLEWSNILHLSERTLQRYKKEKLSFGPLYSERIIEVQLLFNKGVKVFTDKDNFHKWLNLKSVSLGGIKPISLLDNTFGIRMVKDELTRIEHGVLS